MYLVIWSGPNTHLGPSSYVDASLTPFGLCRPMPVHPHIDAIFTQHHWTLAALVWKWEKNATKLRGEKLFPGMVSYLTSSLPPAQSDPGPGEESDQERKRPHSAWLWALLRIRCSPLSPERRKGSGKEDTGWGSGGIRVKCTMSSQLGWHSERLTCGNWAFAFKVSSPGNIFFDGCTSVKKHDDPNDRRRDEEGCI